MNAAIVEADRVSNAGVELGERLWLAAEASMAMGVTRIDAIDTFYCSLEQFTDTIADVVNITDETVALYGASAMLSIRMVVSAERRRQIEAKASDTYGEFLRAQFDQAA